MTLRDLHDEFSQGRYSARAASHGEASPTDAMRLQPPPMPAVPRSSMRPSFGGGMHAMRSISLPHFGGRRG